MNNRLVRRRESSSFLFYGCHKDIDSPTRPLRALRRRSIDTRDIEGASPSPQFQSKKELVNQKLRKAIAEQRDLFAEARKQTFLEKLQNYSPVVKGFRRKYLPQERKYMPIRFIYHHEITPKVGGTCEQPHLGNS